MAATFTPETAYTYAFNVVKKPGPLANIKLDMLQDASSRIWMLAPWRWTVGTIAAITLTNAQEFTITLPGDFLRLERVWIVTTDGAQPLTITATEPVMTIAGTPKSVAYVVNSGDKLRLNCVFPAGSTNSPTLRILYKKKAPDLTSAMATAGALVMDDDYFYIYRNLVLAMAFRFADDPRAGSVTVAYGPKNDEPSVQYTGTYADTIAEIEELRRREPTLFALLDTEPQLLDH